MQSFKNTEFPVSRSFYNLDRKKQTPEARKQEIPVI